eukprot:7391472-Prymnesium_polylepis.1
MCKLLLSNRWQVDKAATAVAEPAQLVLHANVVDDGSGFEDQLEGICGQFASLDRQNARVQEDQGQMRHPPRPRARARPVRGSAEPSPSASACGTSPAAPTRRLPPRSRQIGRQSHGSTRLECPSGARRGLSTAALRRAGGCPRATGRASQRPWPVWSHTRLSRTRASDRRTGSAKGPEDPRRRARQHQECEAERRWQCLLQANHKSGASPSCRSLIVFSAATPQVFDTDKAHCAGEYDDQRPGRTNPNARAIVAQASRRHNEDALKLGWQLEEVDPPGEVLQAQRWLDVVDARYSRDALVEAHQRLDL